MASFYTDFDLSFQRDAVSGDIQTVEDTKAVAQSIRNLIMTRFYERPFQPSVGSAVFLRLFDQFDSIAEFALVQDIRTVIRLFEPRAMLSSVKVYKTKGPDGSMLDEHSILIELSFMVRNIPQIVTTQILLTRLR